MSSTPWRPIAPASSASARRRVLEDNNPAEGKPGRASVPVACLQCRQKKAKCDGARPSCKRCQDLQLSCQYDVHPGISRTERFKLQKQHQEDVMRSLATFVDTLRTGSDQDATLILARLRLGESLEDIVKSLDTGSTPIISANVQALPATTGLNPYIDPVATTTKPNLSMEHFSKLVLSTQSNLPSPTGRSDFLHVLFNREEMRIPTILRKEHEAHLTQSLPHNALSKNSENPTTGFSHGDHYRTFQSIGFEPGTCAMPKHKQISSDTEVNQLLHPRYAAWNTYPMLRDSLTTLTSFKVGRADLFPHSFQQSSEHRFDIPSWAIMTANAEPRAGCMDSAFRTIHNVCTKLIQEGALPEEVFGIQPNIAALLDKKAYESSSILSQWAASMVHSVKLTGSSFTCFASMYVFWYLMRWKISPSRHTYEAIPDWLRPTPNQLFIPHVHMLDFIIWPRLREFVLSIPSMQESTEWLMDLSTTIVCQWSFDLQDALCIDQNNNCTILTNKAKDYMATLSNWSVGPSFRAYVPNADTYVRVRHTL